jgi:hypothetical protein
VVVCHVWRAIGGDLGAVEIALDPASAAEPTVAAFDAFHAMHAEVDAERCSGWSARERAAVAERLRLCAQLATARALNVAVRDLLPAVREAAAVAKAS